MGRFVADVQNFGFMYESGLYASTFTASGLQFIGYYRGHAPDEAVNVLEIRNAGVGTRDVQLFVDGPLDYTGEFSYYPVDFKFLYYALGSCADSWPGSPGAGVRQHYVLGTNNNDLNNWTSGTQNPFISFTLEDVWTAAGAGNNKVITYRGCVVNSYSIAATQGEPVTCTVNYTAQYAAFSSGAPTSMTGSTSSQQSGLRPYMWSDCTLHIPSGTVFDELKSFELTVNNNFDAPHYVNGSRVIAAPIPLNRMHGFTATFNATSERYKTLYDQYFQGGSTFNAQLIMTKSGTTVPVGSTVANFIMSGCKMVDFTGETVTEGIMEVQTVFRPQTLVGSITDPFAHYNLGSRA